MVLQGVVLEAEAAVLVTEGVVDQEVVEASVEVAGEVVWVEVKAGFLGMKDQTDPRLKGEVVVEGVLEAEVDSAEILEEVEDQEIEISEVDEWIGVASVVIEEARGQHQALLKWESAHDMKEGPLILMPMGTRLPINPMKEILQHSLLTQHKYLIGEELEVVHTVVVTPEPMEVVVAMVVAVICHPLVMIVLVVITVDIVLHLLLRLITTEILTNRNIMKVHRLVMGKAENILANHVQDIRLFDAIFMCHYVTV